VTEKQKDVLCWIAAVAIALVLFASCIQVVDPATGEGWNPIMWVLQMAFGAWLLFCAVFWLCYYVFYVPIRWLIRKLRPDPYADYPPWFRKHFLNSINKKAGR
jgi:uncharacterized membrane protein